MKNKKRRKSLLNSQHALHNNWNSNKNCCLYQLLVHRASVRHHSCYSAPALAPHSQTNQAHLAAQAPNSKAVVSSLTSQSIPNELFSFVGNVPSPEARARQPRLPRDPQPVCMKNKKRCKSLLNSQHALHNNWNWNSNKNCCLSQLLVHRASVRHHSCYSAPALAPHSQTNQAHLAAQAPNSKAVVSSLTSQSIPNELFSFVGNVPSPEARARQPRLPRDPQGTSPNAATWLAVQGLRACNNKHQFHNLPLL